MLSIEILRSERSTARPIDTELMGQCLLAESVHGAEPAHVLRQCIPQRAGFGLLICLAAPHAIIEPMAHRTKATRPSTADRAAEEADYRTWKARAVAELERRYHVLATTIPERVWKRLYVQGLTTEDGAKQADVYHYNCNQLLIGCGGDEWQKWRGNDASEEAAVSPYNTRPAFDRLRRR
jgi:hypothetical protein